MRNFIKESVKKQIYTEAYNFTRVIIKNYEEGVLKENYGNILLYLVEIMNIDFFPEIRQTIEEIIIFIISGIREQIYDENFSDLRYSGMISGIGNVAFSIRNLAIETKGLKKFSEYLDQLLGLIIQKYVKSLKEISVIPAHYDVLYGVAGVLYYLLDYTPRFDIVEEIINYLVWLTQEGIYKRDKVINFHIKREQQYLESERREMPDGQINFGLAHGMVGPLIALAKAKYKGYTGNGVDDAIEIIFRMYENFSFYEENIIKFPTQLPYKAYVDKKVINPTFNAGWCYGNLGIVRGLMKSAKYLEYNDKYVLYEKELLKIINQPLEKYNLHVPVLCHGFSSVVAVQYAIYKENRNEAFLLTAERNILKTINEHNKFCDKGYIEKCALLEGAGGVVLSLISAIYPDMKFPKLLMID